MKTGAAENLLNHTLITGWNVIEKLITPPNSTGGNFSTCYKVKKENEIAFLKVLDFAKVFNGLPHDDFIADFLQEATSAYTFERDILLRCKKGRMSKVTTLLEYGQEKIGGYDFEDVPYLIFDIAESTARLELENRIDNTFKLKSLHHISVGINQLHSANIAHQDLKPSNILVYNGGISKIADLGRAICQDLNGPHNNYIIHGDPEYAPPELYYGYYDKNILQRIYCTDLYLLGSMIVFYFTGYSMNAILKHKLHSKFHPNNWKGNLQELMPYLESAFVDSVKLICDNIKPKELSNEIKQILIELCTPNIDKRGSNSYNNEFERFSVYKYINKFNVLYRKSYFELLN